MERYWTLKYLQQQDVRELEATVFKEGLARADALPLVLPVLGTGDLPRGARVRVKLGEIDLITLDVSGTVLQRLDAEPDAPASDEDDSERKPWPVRLRSRWMSRTLPEEARGRAGSCGRR
jgi:exoribonuclease-2